MSQSSNKEKIRQLIVDLQQDVKSYGELRASLDQQRSLLIAHDNQGLQAFNPQQQQLFEVLAQRAAQRVQLLAELGLKADEKGMQTLISRLPPDLSARVNQLWSQLHQLLLACKIQNECNGRLLAGQMELVRSLLQQPAGYPASAF